tara:strand:+ start:1051 stop:1254 length:204 start_codon:yes stop_codon:yes gene_type:complete
MPVFWTGYLSGEWNNMVEPLKGRVWKLEVAQAAMQDTIAALSEQIEELRKHGFQEDEIEKEKANGKS